MTVAPTARPVRRSRVNPASLGSLCRNIMTPQYFQHFHSIFGRNKRNEPAFVRNVQRVKPQHFAGGMNIFANRDGAVFNGNFHTGGFGNFVQGTCQSATGQVAQAMNFNASLDQFQDGDMHRR